MAWMRHSPSTRRSDPKLIFITGSREPANLARIGQDHAAAVLFKPLSDKELRAAVERVMRS